MYRRILVGTDGSPTVAKAVDRAVEVAAASGASHWNNVIPHLPTAVLIVRTT